MEFWHQPQGILQARGATPALLANYLGQPTYTKGQDNLANNCWHYWVNSHFTDPSTFSALSSFSASMRNLANHKGETPLVQAVLLGKFSLVNYWLKHWPEDFSFAHNSQLLTAGVWSGNNQLLELLLNCQQNSLNDCLDSKCRLLTIAFNRLPDLGWEKLLEAGADPNLTDSHARNFLHRVAECGDFKSYEIVATYGADTDQPDNRGLTPQDILVNAQEKSASLCRAYHHHWHKLYQQKIFF